MSGTEMLTTVLAQPEFPGGDTPGGQGEGFGKSTPLGLFLLLVLLIGVVFLVRSMSKHLKKVSTRFDQERATAAAPARVRKAEAAKAAAAAKAEAEAAEADAAESEASRGDGAAEAEDSGTARSPDTGDGRRTA
ncbi:hypothetical protein [Haloactinomyces albus]|uniref:Tfp pilus assembly protein PilX n=1 Tax=Haloactinomyces albus TaxID=1352928 RepID=A0AAE3ZD47_9ACTN|nr:hypothetical protein [Haloactinomyces albus]MDR7302717.1 Tfp pilus assembly protein PilX [Haloactinomyces albus]